MDLSIRRLSHSLMGLCKLLRPTHICIEAPFNNVGDGGNAHTAMALIQITGALRAIAALNDATVSLYPVQTVRKHFIGQGNLKATVAKPMVQERCRVLGWDFGGSADRADATAVWALGMAKHYPDWAPQGTPLFAGARSG